MEALFRAHSDKELFAEWIGPGSYENTVTDWDFPHWWRYRFEQRDEKGEVYASPWCLPHRPGERDHHPDLRVRGLADGVSIDVIRFESLPGGRSRIVDHSVFESVATLDAFLKEGMTDGMEAGYAKLDELLAR